MDDIKEYYPILEEVIKEKRLNNFWLICGQSEFKPVFKSRDEIIEKIKKKADQFKGLDIANIVILFKPSSDIDRYKIILSIHIVVYKIDDKGMFNTNYSVAVNLTITYTKDELNKNHFTIDELML